MSETHDNCLSEPEQLAVRFGGLLRFDHIVIAVSGGSDSIALLRLVGLWLSGVNSELPTISVITVDHRLRQEAAEEAAFVAGVCSELGLTHRTLAWNDDKPSTGILEAAREARYEFLINAARVSGNSVILTAHTLDDQAETVLMRMARGSGPDGLAAIPEETARGNVAIMRPLLDVTREQLRSFLKGIGQDWRDDPSNDLTEFERIRIRNAQSARSELNLTDRALAQTARRMERARNSLDRVTQELLQRETQRQTLLRYGVFQWPSGFFGQYGPEIGLRCLRRVVHVFGGGRTQPNLSQTEALYHQMSDNGFRGTTLHGTRLIRVEAGDAGQVFILRETGRTGLDELSLHADMRTVWDNRFPVTTSLALHDGFTIRPLHQDDLRHDGTPSLEEIPAEIRRDILLTLPVILHSGTLCCVPHFEESCSDIQVDMSRFAVRLVE